MKLISLVGSLETCDSAFPVQQKCNSGFDSEATKNSTFMLSQSVDQKTKEIDSRTLNNSIMKNISEGSGVLTEKHKVNGEAKVSEKGSRPQNGEKTADSSDLTKVMQCMIGSEKKDKVASSLPELENSVSESSESKADGDLNQKHNANSLSSDDESMKLEISDDETDKSLSIVDTMDTDFTEENETIGFSHAEVDNLDAMLQALEDKELKQDPDKGAGEKGTAVKETKGVQEEATSQTTKLNNSSSGTECKATVSKTGNSELSVCKELSVKDVKNTALLDASKIKDNISAVNEKEVNTSQCEVSRSKLKDDGDKDKSDIANKVSDYKEEKECTKLSDEVGKSPYETNGCDMQKNDCEKARTNKLGKGDDSISGTNENKNTVNSSAVLSTVKDGKVLKEESDVVSKKSKQSESPTEPPDSSTNDHTKEKGEGKCMEQNNKLESKVAKKEESISNSESKSNVSRLPAEGDAGKIDSSEPSHLVNQSKTGVASGDKSADVDELKITLKKGTDDGDSMEKDASECKEKLDKVVDNDVETNSIKAIVEGESETKERDPTPILETMETDDDDQKVPGSSKLEENVGRNEAVSSSQDKPDSLNDRESKTDNMDIDAEEKNKKSTDESDNGKLTLNNVLSIDEKSVTSDVSERSKIVDKSEKLEKMECKIEKDKEGKENSDAEDHIALHRETKDVKSYKKQDSKTEKELGKASTDDKDVSESCTDVTSTDKSSSNEEVCESVMKSGLELPKSPSETDSASKSVNEEQDKTDVTAAKSAEKVAQSESDNKKRPSSSSEERSLRDLKKARIVRERKEESSTLTKEAEKKVTSASEKESTQRSDSGVSAEKPSATNDALSTVASSDKVLKRPNESEKNFIEVKKVKISPELQRHGALLLERDQLLQTKVKANKSEQKSADDCMVVSESGESSAEKSKQDAPAEVAEPLPKQPLPVLRDLQKTMKTLSRNELEELLIQKVCEVITNRSDVGEMRQRCDSLEQLLEQWRKKAHQLQKQVNDLSMVVKKFLNDQRTKRDKHVAPVKITRSVGLQVQMQAFFVGNKGGNRMMGTAQGGISKVGAGSKSPQGLGANRPTQSTAAAQKTLSPSGSPLSGKAGPGSLGKSQTLSGKVLGTRPGVSSATGTCKTLKPSQSPAPRRIASSATTTASPSSSATTTTTVAAGKGVKVIDLTDEEMPRSKLRPVASSNTTTTSAASSPLVAATTASLSAATTLTTVNTSVLSAALNAPVTVSASSSVGGGGIRVVPTHQLANAPQTMLAQTNTTNAAGPRLAYLVPTSAVPVQQRQLLIASSGPQVRPVTSIQSSGVRQPMQTVMLKGGSFFPVQQGGRTPTILQSIGPATNAPIQQVIGPARVAQPFRVAPGLVSSTGGVTSTVPSQALAAGKGMPLQIVQHPAPLPLPPSIQPSNPAWKLAPPRPSLKISKVSNGIVLSWNMTITIGTYEEIASYQLYAYQEGPAPPSTSLWKKVGDVKALPLPMACTLTQFMEGHKYHFAVRAVDVHSRVGPFSAPGSILLVHNK